MDDGWVYLCGAAQEIEADIIAGLLEEQKIPIRKKYLGAGEFTKIASGLTSGIDIYVPQKYLTEGQAVIKVAKSAYESFDIGADNARVEAGELDDGLNRRYEEEQSLPLNGTEVTDSRAGWWLGLLAIIILLVVVFVVRTNGLF